MPTYEDIFRMSPEELVLWLHETFQVDIPSNIETANDLSQTSELILMLTGYYSYLAELLSYAKICVRKAKREGSKETWEDMVDRKDVIERKFDAVKHQYNALSRIITVKIEANKEMYMERNF